MGRMTVLITGASGFIGERAVAAARKRGHLVVAVLRRAEAAPKAWAADGGIMTVVVDLAAKGAEKTLTEAMQPVDVVIHAAAKLGGDDAEQSGATLTGTRTVIAAMLGRDGAAPRLVLVSSLSVYGATGLQVGGSLTEKSPLETHPDMRDAYCRGKLAQEDMVKKAALKHGFPLWILRPGAVYGPGRAWNAHLGIGLGPLLLQVGRGGEVPLSHVEHCAEAMVLAAEVTPKDGAIEFCNVVDSVLPTRSAFVAEHQRSGWPLKAVVLPYGIFSLMSKLIAYLPDGLRAKLPGLLRRPVLDARMKPLTYPNKILRERLGWQPSREFSDALREAWDE
ncbi:NAD-dependent epimerase/dehydratase family protein [Algicella marina]|uniref:NAD-dependent epimerase/dehydratase family protein n=1 Tax=Algicella marina TaxID=2683284 RepID=A0A6P1STR3_9RHOB|nr:NAD(P)-dependent oxidoreductase [Algicella marina]QHQ34074.1 NAD-dependent epimerase/dehydratase family protein [Algicella marina]